MNGISKSKKQKKFWKGVFHFRTTTRVEYAWAVSEKQAAAKMFRRISYDQGIPIATLKDSVIYSVNEETYEPPLRFGKAKSFA